MTLPQNLRYGVLEEGKDSMDPRWHVRCVFHCLHRHFGGDDRKSIDH